MVETDEVEFLKGRIDALEEAIISVSQILIEAGITKRQNFPGNTAEFINAQLDSLNLSEDRKSGYKYTFNKMLDEAWQRR